MIRRILRRLRGDPAHLASTGGHLCLPARDRRRGDPRWQQVWLALERFHDARGVDFDDDVEATFREGDDATAHRKPWVGVVHGDGPFDALLADPRVAMSLNNCAGLFTTSTRATGALRDRLDVPVSVLPPPEDPEALARAVEGSDVHAALQPTGVASFVLFAHPRSGSTTLERALAAHPQLRILGEPFNPYIRKQDQDGHYRYLAEAKSETSLARCLDRMFHHFTGIRHLMPGRPAEGRTRPWDAERINRQILARAERRILLSRRNRLQTVVSELMSTQTQVWQRDEGAIDRRLEPVEVADVVQRMDWLRDDVQQYRDFLDQAGLAYHEVFYEEIFAPDLDPAQKRQRVAALFDHLGADPPSEAVWREIDGLLDPGQTKLNSDDTYRLIPNADELEAALGGDENGRLFAP